MSINNNNNDGNASVSPFIPILEPIIPSIDLAEMEKFLKECGRYGLEIKSKQSEIRSLNVLPCKATIEHLRLDNIVFMGKFKTIASDTDTDNLTADKIENFVKVVIEKKYVLYDPLVIEKSLKGLRMAM